MKKIVYFIYGYCITKFNHFLSRYFPKIFKYRQTKKLKNHLLFVKNNSPFYSELLKDIETPSLKNFPIIDKIIMMDNLDRINTKKLQMDIVIPLAIKAENDRNFTNKIGDISYGLSSGTSGNRGIFLISDKESSIWAGVMFAKLGHLRNKLLKKMRLAFFMRANNNLYESIGNKWFQFMFFDIFADYEENLKKLNEYRPTIIIAQPSMMKLLAKDYKDNSFCLQETFTIAEVLDEETETYIKESFKVNNYNIYQATEGFIGSTYKDNKFYINDDLIFIEKEYVDENRFIPIITDLNRITQPIVRYRLNDILIEDKVVHNRNYSFTPIKAVEGRSDEYFEFQNKDGKNIKIFPDFIRNSVIKSSSSILDYNIYQKHKNTILIEIHSENPNDEKVVYESIKNLLKHYKLTNIEIKTVIQPIIREKGKKLRRIFREI